ncbi:hypothetical protein GCM10023149_12310 [Mucilaginibacter gynuensis]|uniref:Uncharacterized protein n=1 Tax=Mucilaginibacter gynuensis TaxID=1302236 RepID=A0ABP8G1T6_9SPHI
MSFTVNAQQSTLPDDDSDDVESYDYQTNLVGAYKILFKVDDDTEYLYLTKKGKIISELSSISKGMPHKNLGYVGADFKDYFVLVHSFGSGNPNQIELIAKSTGKNIISPAACWIDADVKKETLLYCDKGVPTPNDKMILYNIRTRQKKYFAFPADIFGEPMILGRMKIKKLDSKFLLIEYDIDGDSRTRRYTF